MKIWLTLCLAAVFGGLLTASAQTPAAAPRSHSLSVQVEPVRSGSTTQMDQDTHKNTFGGHQGSTQKLSTTQTQTTEESTAIQIIVRNFGQLSDTAQVEWYFVAGPVKPDTTKPLGDQQSIFDSGTRSVTLAPGGTQAIPVASKGISSQIERRNLVRVSKSGRVKPGKHGTEEVSGSKMEGWIVRVVADGKVVDARASKDTLAEVAKDDAKLNALKD